MVDLGFIYMMFLKDYLQYEKHKKTEKQRSRKAGKQRSRKTGKQRSRKKQKSKKKRSRKAKKQGNRNQTKNKTGGKKIGLHNIRHMDISTGSSTNNNGYMYSMYTYTCV